MDPSPCIRDARADELGALEELQWRSSLVWDDHRADLLAHPDAIEVPDSVLADGSVRVAERDGRVVGFSVVLGGPGTVRELDGLFVEPDAMGTGVGRALVADVTSALDEDDATLEVTANANAVGFYERVGFEGCGTVDTRFGSAVRMRWTGR